MKTVSTFLGVFLLCGLGLRAAEQPQFRPRPHDWPQWRGANRDGRSSETGLLHEWPKGGPRLLWKARNLGQGHAAVSVAAGRIFSLGTRGSNLFVVALDERNGKELWARRLGGPWQGEGPNSTPAWDEDRVYAILPPGDVLCLDASTGRERWRRSLAKEYGARFPGRGTSESPLVDGDRVICTPGGPKATLVAFDKRTGKTLWQARVPQGDKAAYASSIPADVDGQRQYIQLLSDGVVGVAARDGKFLWRYDKPANSAANCSTPLYSDHHVFAATAYDRGGGLARLVNRGSGTEAKEVYFTPRMQNHHGGMVIVDGYLYGAHGGNSGVPRLVCLEFLTGKVMWEERRASKGALAYADGRLYFRNENGIMRLVETSPRGYAEHGRFTQPDRSSQPAWAHPVIANGRLYLRDQNLLLCYDVKPDRS